MGPKIKLCFIQQAANKVYRFNGSPRAAFTDFLALSELIRYVSVGPAGGVARLFGCPKAEVLFVVDVPHYIGPWLVLV